MRKGRARRGAAVVVTVVLGLAMAACQSVTVTGANGPGSSDPLMANCPNDGAAGITDTSIKIGASNPLSGPAASPIPKGFQAYFDYINSQGGVPMKDGRTRTIEYTVYDDGYEPSRARSNAERLINRDKVFALIGMYGTPGNLASRPLVTENCIPNLYMTSGHAEFGNPQYPWLAAPVAPSYLADARAAGKYLLQVSPHAKVGILSQNDDLGESFLHTFEDRVRGTGIEIVEHTTFEPTDTAVSAQITTLAGSGADTFMMLAGTGTYQLQALESIVAIGWKPAVKYLSNFSARYLDQLSPEAAENLFFGLPWKNPSDPQWNDDPAMQHYLEWWKKQPSAASFNPFAAQLGWMGAMFFVENLKAMEQPTRAALLQTATHYTHAAESLYLPGITYSVDWPDSPYGIVDSVITTYDPSAPRGRKYKEVVVIKQEGEVRYEPMK